MRKENELEVEGVRFRKGSKGREGGMGREG